MTCLTRVVVIPSAVTFSEHRFLMKTQQQCEAIKISNCIKGEKKKLYLNDTKKITDYNFPKSHRY